MADESKLTEEEWRDSTMARIDVNLTRISRDLTRIHLDLDDRPKSAEVTRSRRGSVVLLICLIFGTAMVVDYHTEVCGPGHRSERIVEAMLRGEVRDRAAFERVSRDATPSDLCGLTFPLHSHDFKAWPQSQHVFGMLIYAVAFAFGFLWWRWPSKQQAEADARHEMEGEEDEMIPPFNEEDVYKEP